METDRPISITNIPNFHVPPIAAQAEPRRSADWLLELETDGTIRYSNLRPQNADGSVPVVGSNLFELSNIRDLSAFKPDFVGFVRSDKNRQTFYLRTGSGSEDAVVVLTRSFDRTDSGSTGKIVLMELKSI